MHGYLTINMNCMSEDVAFCLSSSIQPILQISRLFTQKSKLLLAVINLRAAHVVVLLFTLVIPFCFGTFGILVNYTF